MNIIILCTACIQLKAHKYLYLMNAEHVCVCVRESVSLSLSVCVYFVVAIMLWSHAVVAPSVAIAVIFMKWLIQA